MPDPHFVGMAIEDEVRTVVTDSSLPSSFTPEFLVSGEKRDDLSPDDVAWVDSCLITESEISDSSWASMKDALLEALNSEPVLYNSSKSHSDERIEDNDDEMLMLREQVEADHSLNMEDETEEFPRTSLNLLPSKEEAESSSDNNFAVEEVSDSQSLSFNDDPFLPSFGMGLKETKTTASSSDSSSASSAVDEIEPSTDEIFRVWDLNVPEEENELTVQLKKILEENDLQSMPSVDSGAKDDLKELSLDNVIDAIAKISLSQDSTS